MRYTTVTIRICAALLLLGVADVLAQDLPVRYDTDYLPASFHESRRAAVLEALPPDGVAVFFSSPERRRENDTEYAYRQDSDLYYLTGTTEPNSILLLSPRGVDIDGQRYQEVLFVPPRTQYSDVWVGRRFGAERAEEELGIAKAVSNERFVEVIERLPDDVQFFHLPLPDGYERGSELAEQVEAFTERAQPLGRAVDAELQRQVMFALGTESPDQFSRAQSAVREGTPSDGEDGVGREILSAFTAASSFDEWQEWRAQNVDQRYADGTTLRGILNDLRIQKTDEEMALLRRAIDITVDAHREVARAIEPGMHEYEAQAIIEYVFMREGSEAPGFASIVASGENSVILHYSTNRRQMEADDMVVIDIGAEYRGYTADITRTLPVNGVFSEEQRAIYEIVLEAQEAGIEAARAGNSFGAPGQVATMIIAEGLQELGLIESPEQVRRFFMHGTSHYLGLYVHDVGDYGELQPGQVITVEPGIYISPADDVDRRWWNIGVRIEDDVLITEGDPEVMSLGAPRTVEEVESLMREESQLVTTRP